MNIIIKRFLIVVFLWPIWSFPLSTVAAQPALPPQITAIITHSKAANAFWAITVRDSTGKILAARNSKKLIRPASNLKLLTSAAVLDELGPNFRYHTNIYGRGHLKKHTWQGDIYVRGVGDPSISGKFYHDDRLHVMNQFDSLLTAKGITLISGNLIGNDAFFDDKPYPDGWSWDDLTYYYAVPINALSFNNNTVDLTVYASGKIGSTPKIEWFPFNTDYVSFVNEQQIAPKKASYDEHYHRILGTNIIKLGSSLPQGYVEKESLSITNPPLYFMDTFKKYLEDGGITVKGSPLRDDNSHNWKSGLYKKLGGHQSPPLKALVKELNKHSNNFYAEMLLKTLAARHYHTRGTTELGVQLVKDFAGSTGINTHTLSMSDGSGMSATDLISTADLSLLLVALQRKSYFKQFKRSLPVAGVDGSLEHRFTNSPLKANIMAKTGYVSGVRSLSGYLKTKRHKTLIFSIVTNNYTTATSYIDSIQDSILGQLYNRY